MLVRLWIHPMHMRGEYTTITHTHTHRIVSHLLNRRASAKGEISDCNENISDMCQTTIQRIQSVYRRLLTAIDIPPVYISTEKFITLR